MIYNNALELVGNTPIVRLNKVVPHDLGCNFFAKVEFFNPGGSIKDRIGYWMIDDAEKKGLIKPGGTIVESTSGNTGMGLAIAAAIRGYKCVFVLPDKMSEEKIRALRAFGARVIVTPTAVEPDDPRSYYQVARRIARETPNSIYMNQYDNLSNREAHYKMTGPEIYKQMPEIDVIVAGIGTGGTICGTSKFLKEKKPSVKAVAVDPVGSIVYDKFNQARFKKGNPNPEAKPYKIEGIGEDFIPQNYDFDIIDEVVQAEDKESFMITRDLLTLEGLYVGPSAGAALVGAIKYAEAHREEIKGKNILVILPDSGNRYLSKVFDDDWMREAGFLDTESLGLVSHLLSARKNSGETHSEVIMAKPNSKVSTVVEMLRDRGISQMPVTDDKGFIKGVVTESAILNALYQGKVKPSDTVEGLVDSSIEFVRPEDTIERVTGLLSNGKVPLVTDTKTGKPIAILTKIDLLNFLSRS